MKPTDIRNENWTSLQLRLSALQASVLVAWKIHGPGTTREVCQRAGIDILTFRPRTTELYQCGLIECINVSSSDARGHEGVYSVRTPEDWQAWKTNQFSAAVAGQLQLV